MTRFTRERISTVPIVLIAVVGALVLGGCGEAPIQLPHAAELVKIDNVAVIPFVDAPGSQGSGEVVITAAMMQLYKCPGIRVFERRRLKALIDEHDLMLAMSSEAEVAAKIGKLTGADAVILGEVMQYEAQQEYGHATFYVVSGGGTEHIHRVGLSVRAVSVKDGRVIYSELGQGESKKGYSEAARIAAQRALSPWMRFFRQRANGTLARATQ
jgi:curli biogenesis system outer membrane secretion channel CsgG